MRRQVDVDASSWLAVYRSTLPRSHETQQRCRLTTEHLRGNVEMDLKGSGKTKALVEGECNALQRDLCEDLADRSAAVHSFDYLPKVGIAAMENHVEMQ